MKSRISCSENFRVTTRKPKKPINRLPEVVLREDPRAEEASEKSEEPEEIVAKAEARAREDQRKAWAKRGSKWIGSEREYADSLHRQADILHHRGDYEAALVLYHRASTAYPREPSHGVAVLRTTAAISSATNPSGALKKSLPRSKNAAQLAANYCPETAALRARKVVEESSDPVSAIDQILKYFDSRKDFLRDLPIFHNRRRSMLLSRSKIMLRQLSNMANSALQNLQSSVVSGDSKASLKIAEELITVSAALPDCFRYQVAARHYLAMTQISLGRHDRAVDQVSRMVRLAKESGDAALRSKSFVTLGKVHLSFGHLEAAARAWERLVTDVEEAVPKAWMLHEIGRCYFEMKRYRRALETAGRCLEYADEVNSTKWLLHGKLLSGQALVELGRFGEAVQVLKAALRDARQDEDASTVEYVSDLIDRVTGLLRRAAGLDNVDEQKNLAAEREDKAWKASKSENTLRGTQRLEWTRDKRKNLSELSDSMEKSKIVVSKSLRKNTKSTKCARMKNVRTLQKRRKDIAKMKNPILRTIYPSRSSGTFDISASEDDANPLETPKARIMSLEPNQQATDLSTRRHFAGDFVETEHDLLTSRTRVICTKISNIEDLPKTSECLDENDIEVDRDRFSNSDSDNSHGTGATYVLDEFGNSAITETKALATSRDENLAMSRPGDESGDGTEITRVLDNSGGAEYLRDERSDDLEISRLRARLCDEEIDEEEEEEEDDEEVEGSSLKDREYSSPRESKVSAASTGKTYLVDERKTMSHNSYETRSRYVAYEETMSNEKKYTDASLHFSSGIRNASRIITSDDIIESMGDSADNSMFVYQGKTRNLENLEVQQSTAEIREKHNSCEWPTRSTFSSSERRGNGTQGIRTSLEQHLATRESISTPRSHSVVSSTG